MKIGDFAKKYNMNVTAVRYYVDRTLLTPERKNNQYIFDESCMKDMEKILKYKEFRFTLEEIELLFFLEKTTKFRDDTVLEIFSNLLDQKKTELENEEREIHKIIENLKDEIKEFQSIEHHPGEESLGIPITFIPNFCCPNCGSPTSLESAIITNNKLTSGELTCSCGYKNKIENGIILCEGYMESTPFKAFENIESVVSLTEDYGNEYISLMDKSYMWMYHQVMEIDAHHIMAGPFTVNFLLKYCDRFSSNTTFIVVDPSLKRISKIQDYMKDFDFQTVFFAGNINRIPIKKECVDVYIDDYSSNNCIFTYNQSPYTCVAPLLKKGGCSIGLFIDYKESPKSRASFIKDHPDFIPENMSFEHVKTDIKNSGMKTDEIKLIGKTSGKDKQILRQVGNEKIPFIGFKASK